MSVDPATFRWALDKRIELQADADVLWDDLDSLQSIEDYQATLNAYNDVCDQIDLLEKSPECLKNGHLWVTDNSGDIAPVGRYTYCQRCGCDDEGF